MIFLPFIMGIRVDRANTMLRFPFCSCVFQSLCSAPPESQSSLQPLQLRVRDVAARRTLVKPLKYIKIGLKFISGSYYLQYLYSCRYILYMYRTWLIYHPYYALARVDFTASFRRVVSTTIFTRVCATFPFVILAKEISQKKKANDNIPIK